MSQSVAKEVRSVLIPLHELQLLLPNAVIAEVIGYQLPEPADEGMPDWFVGNFIWRGVVIPVISFEGMLGERVVIPGSRGRIMVMNTLGQNQELTHIGLLVQAIPSLVRVSADNVVPVTPEEEFNPLIKQQVELDRSPAVIPDLDQFERQVLEVVS
ncbi:MAG: chemotaxis protein CheW [gamma proteobacterium symbiont of Ctena orbiculata]